MAKRKTSKKVRKAVTKSKEKSPRRPLTDGQRRFGREFSKPRKETKIKTPVDSKQRVATTSIPPKPVGSSLWVGASLMDLRMSNPQIVKGSAYITEPGISLSIIAMGCWTLPLLRNTGRQTHEFPDGLILIVDSVETNQGFVNGKEVVRLPLGFAEFGVVIHQVSIVTGERTSPATVIYLPRGTFAKLQSAGGNKRSESATAALLYIREGPWELQLPPVPPKAA